MAKRFMGFARYVLARFQKDGASGMAASLSYTSLLSLVPLLAIALAMLAAFPVFDGIRTQLMTMAFQNFVPAVGSVVQGQIDSFMANAGKLTAAGVVGLVFTAIMLLVTIEDCFNQVFRVARKRTALARLLVYWTALTLGPLLIGASLSLQTYLAAMNRWELTQFISPIIAAPLPFLLSALAFTGLLATIPNRRIRLKDAIIGGIMTALLFAGLRWGFALYITSSKAYSNLYGAVATIPIFLFWMFLCWAVVLMGAEIAAALPEWRAGYHQSHHHSPGARRLTIALDVLALLLKASATASLGLSRHDLLAATALPEHDLAPVLHRLCTTAFTAALAQDRFLLARDLDAASLDDLIVALELDLSLDDAVATGALWRGKVGGCLDAAREVQGAALAVSLKAVLG